MLHASGFCSIALEGILDLLGVEALDVADALHRDRWFLPWRESGFGIASVLHSANANFLSS